MLLKAVFRLILALSEGLGNQSPLVLKQKKKQVFYRLRVGVLNDGELFMAVCSVMSK